MSYPTPWQGPPPAGSGAPSMLASHADRERAVDVLRAGYGEGRLDHPEFEKRVARAYSARTVGELSLLVADLPQGPMAQPMTPPARSRPRSCRRLRHAPTARRWRPWCAGCCAWPPRASRGFPR